MSGSRKKSKRAVEKLAKQFRSSPDHKTALQLVSEYRKREELDHAENILLEAIGEMPDILDLRIELANLYFEMERVQDAADVCNSVLELSPDNEDVFPILKKIAKNHQLKTQNAEPDTEESAAFSDATQYLRAGDFEQALTLFKEILDEDPDNEDAIAGFKLAYAGMIADEDDSEDIESDIASGAMNVTVLKQTITILEYWAKVAGRRRQS